MVLQAAKRLSNAYLFFRHSVFGAQRIAYCAVENMTNRTIGTASDVMSEGFSQLHSMKRIMTVPEVFEIQASFMSSIGGSCMEHAQLSMEEVIETQIHLNELVGHNLEEFSPIFENMGFGFSYPKKQ